MNFPFKLSLKLIICYISSGATNIAEVSSGFHQANSGWPAPGKTLENLEKPGICNRGLKNLEKLFILKKKLEKHEFALKKP